MYPIVIMSPPCPGRQAWRRAGCKGGGCDQQPATWTHLCALGVFGAAISRVLTRSASCCQWSADHLASLDCMHCTVRSVGKLSHRRLQTLAAGCGRWHPSWSPLRRPAVGHMCCIPRRQVHTTCFSHHSLPAPFGTQVVLHNFVSVHASAGAQANDAVLAGTGPRCARQCHQQRQPSWAASHDKTGSHMMVQPPHRCSGLAILHLRLSTNPCKIIVASVCCETSVL